MRQLLPAILAFFLAGCAASGTALQPTPETVKSYNIGEAMETNVGSALVSGGRVQTLPAFSPTRTITPPGRGMTENQAPQLQPNQRWVAVAELDGGGYLLNPPESYPAENNSLAINADGSIGDGWYAGRGGNTEMVQSGDWPDGQVFEQTDPVPQEGSFEFEILYSGKDGNTVNMAYREYVDGMQRADYSQDLSYNVAEQDTVSYKSIRIHVKEATSSSIRYEVVEDEGLPWLP
jgi:hypothetical protein